MRSTSTASPSASRSATATFTQSHLVGNNHTHTCTHSQAPRARLHVHALAPPCDCACVTGSASRPLEVLVLFVGHAPLTVARMVQGGGSAKKAISSKASAVGQVTPTACSAHSTPPHAARVTEGARGNRTWHTRRRVRAHTAHADHRCRIDTRGHSGGRPDLPGRWTTGRRRPSRRSRDCRRSHPLPSGATLPPLRLVTVQDAYRGHSAYLST